MDITGGFIWLGLMITIGFFLVIFGGVEKPHKGTSIPHQIKRK